ncbi:V-type ATP synthase subunit F [Demequina salsinemoris]|uniref:V-type ATP synthase subunit F n=1 Tax=Demequina salsinemoris TaxID=577470 RepID=UPI00078422D7|nr:V-type ATP synthase subunit F [Demequina salsinemoris]
MTHPAALTEGVVVAIGERRIVDAFSLAGVEALPAEDAAAARAAWDSLAPDVALVLLSASAADALGDAIDAIDAPLTAVIPS